MTTKKILTRLKLVQWHYFDNETINFSSANLLSGENGSGKSTVLDALQLILTTNTRHFNVAANENSKRTLKGYVRGKTGEDGHTAYKRNGSVISYIALEVYEESKNRYFVIGAKFDSPDQESSPITKWFCEECTLDDLSFIVENKPARDDQFRNHGRKVNFIRQSSAARERFQHRLGNLQDTFFDLIAKSIAFKPMKDVRSFVSQFILPEKSIDVSTLRENINALKSMQDMLAEVKKQVSVLESIIAKNTETDETCKQILIIDILLKIAEWKNLQQRIRSLEIDKEKLTFNLDTYCEQEKQLRQELEQKRNQQIEITVAINTNECTRLVQQYENDIRLNEQALQSTDNRLKRLNTQIAKIKTVLNTVPELKSSIGTDTIELLTSETADDTSKNSAVSDIQRIFKEYEHNLSAQKAQLCYQEERLSNELKKLSEELDKLKINQFTYDENTTALQRAIADEFNKRGISSPVRIFADLLEVTDNRWQNAIEGYLNTQRFHIIVEPRYYDIAAAVYDRMKRRIHTAALVNTAALDIGLSAPDNSLAAFVSSKNRYAAAYVDYLLGRVTVCNDVSELKQHKIAIIKECMLYQGKALRKINPEVYRIPFIGKYALQKQREIKEAEYKEKLAERQNLHGQINRLEKMIAVLSDCQFDTVLDCLSAPKLYRELNQKISLLKNELKKARNNPAILHLQAQSEELGKEIAEKENIHNRINQHISKCEIRIQDIDRQISNLRLYEQNVNAELTKLSEDNETAYQEAEKKYNQNEKTKSADVIFSNYQPRRQSLSNTAIKQEEQLNSLQSNYKNGELGIGKLYIPDYLREYEELIKNDLVEYEEKLKIIQDNCETEFRESFLSKMRENMITAIELFQGLNKTLKPISYGGDCYQFRHYPSPSKQRLYEMITSKFNIDGFSLFSQQFDREYHDEMDELFSKLTQSDENGNDILREYTDYRNYMDYDIEILSKNGRTQKFSSIYREKSGGETQTPYYVAIAASFSQIYSYNESIRIIILDEAFDKMDEERIENMMRFFKELDFQVILAAPSSRMEIIGECTDKILMIYKDSDRYSSIVEEFSL